MFKRLFLLSTFILALSLTQAHGARVVVSIAPIHSLVSAVMGETGTPHLIVSGAGSPHTYQLKPSDATALQEADAIFWIDEDMETFMAQPLANLPQKAAIVTLADIPGMTFPPKEDEHDHDKHAQEEHDDHNHAGHHHHGERDMHIWLNPSNAAKMVPVIADTLSKVDPTNDTLYHENAQKLTVALTLLSNDMEKRLGMLKNKPFMVFHDGYGHLVHRFGLEQVGSLSLSPEHQIGAKRLREIRHHIEEDKVRCVFAEPQFKAQLVDTVIEGTDAQKSVLDPLGANLKIGPDLYPALMKNLTYSFESCLKD